MADDPQLIIQVPRGSAVERRLREEPPGVLSGHDVLIQAGPTDDQGVLEALAGEAVLSVPSSEALARQADDVRRVLSQAGTGTAPLVIVVEAAEDLRDEELAPVLDGAGHASRPVILRVIRPSETP
jgi:hypothetical protein